MAGDPEGTGVDIVVASYEALNRGDIDAAMDALAEDAEWHESGALPDAGGHYVGRDSIRAFLTEFLASWESFEQEIVETRGAGDRLAVFIHLTAVGRGSSVEVDASYAHVWTMKGGVGARVDAFYERDEALAAITP
ncbi:MAG TPA: nuclear transport factor 2 family protein [Solirubrobacterales bacterium]|nr:nuclear transport factor 2 family protein [Solirubrobacterales bacterium]